MALSARLVWPSHMAACLEPNTTTIRTWSPPPTGPRSEPATCSARRGPISDRATGRSQGAISTWIDLNSSFSKLLLDSAKGRSCGTDLAAESTGPRLGAGSQARRANARGRSPPVTASSPLLTLLLLTMTLLLLTMPMLGRAGAWECPAGPCCGEPEDAGDPSARSSAARTAAQRPPAGAA
jgi:hypothetical protein